MVYSITIPIRMNRWLPQGGNEAFFPASTKGNVLFKRRSRMAITKNQLFQIAAGPSREELFDALRLYNEGRELEFAVFVNANDTRSGAPQHAFKALVQQIGAEDGSGYRWLIWVNVVHSDKVTQSFFKGARLEGYLDTRRRGGWLRAIS